MPVSGVIEAGGFSFEQWQWLAGLALTLGGVCVAVVRVALRSQEHRELEQERRLTALEAADAAAAALLAGLRDELHQQYVRADGLERMRLELRGELRELRDEVKGDMRGISERAERTETAMHQRLSGIGRQLDRLLGRLGAEDAART